MKYALIGCGRISINHIKAAHSNQLTIVGLCDLKHANIASMLAKCDWETSSYPQFSDFKKMIGEVNPDIVAIATESGSHAAIAIYCLSKGINVIVEKPMAMSIADARLMIETAKNHNAILSVCHQNRFNHAVMATKKAMIEGRFGKISHAAMCVRWNRDINYYSQAKWRGTWENDGGALMNQCIHGIDLLLYLIGSPVQIVYGQTRKQFHHYLETEDTGMGIISFANGAIGTIEGSVNVFPKNFEETLHLFGEQGTVKIGGTSTNSIDIWRFSDQRSEDSACSSIREETSNVYGNGHKLLYNDTIDAIKNKRPPLVSGEEGLKALEIVLSIYKSELTDNAVKLPLTDFSTLDMKEHF